MSGLLPCYTSENNLIFRGSFRSDISTPVCNWDIANGYRLPTEGEWQFTASNKGATPYNELSGSSLAYHVAWHSGNSGSKTHDVGTQEPNELQIYDMSGHIAEWCWVYSGSYPFEPESNYRGPVCCDHRRIFRGGSWQTSEYDCSVGYRDENFPENEFNQNPTNSILGFRVAKRAN
jgi:formylglycine-generating enzyme required for sulfatase activity